MRTGIGRHRQRRARRTGAAADSGGPICATDAAEYGPEVSNAHLAFGSRRVLPGRVYAVLPGRVYVADLCWFAGTDARCFARPDLRCFAGWMHAVLPGRTLTVLSDRAH